MNARARGGGGAARNVPTSTRPVDIDLCGGV